MIEYPKGPPTNLNLEPVSAEFELSILDYLFGLLLDCDGILLAANECYDGAFVALAPIHIHRIIQIHINGCPVPLRGAFQPTSHCYLLGGFGGSNSSKAGKNRRQDRLRAHLLKSQYAWPSHRRALAPHAAPSRSAGRRPPCARSARSRAGRGSGWPA